MDISDPAWGINTFDILNNLPIGVHIFDAKGMNSIFVNPKFLDIHEITREDVQDFGKFMAHVFPDSNQQEQFKQEFRETVVLSTPVKPFWVEKEIRIQNGKKRRVLITNIPFLNAENRELIACFAQDVTDRYEISEKMKELASLYQFINEYANDIIGIVDFNYKIIHINRAGINLLGYDVHEVIGQSIFQYVPERYHELMKAMANRKRTMNIPNTYYELELKGVFSSI